jgi:hypothetical protein
MRALYQAPTRGAWGLITGVCLAGSLLTSCNAPDDVQGPRGVTGVDIGIQPSVVPTGGLIGEWKLDGNVNDTRSGFHATLFGSPPYIGAKIGQGLDLTGNGTGGTGGKYAEMPANAMLNDLAEGAAYSISAWFNPASAPSGADASQFWMVVGKASGQAIGIVYNWNQKFAARHFLDGNLLQLATATTQSALNQWHHVVAVVKKGSSTVPGSLTLYVDGDSMTSDTWAGGTAAKDFGTTAKWRIGKSDIEWSAHGRVDQVRFYNVALTQANVTSLFQETAPGPTFRFPVSMVKGQQTDLLGMDNTPDGHMVAGTPNRARELLDAARAAHARITIRVAGGNEQLGSPGPLNLEQWKANFTPMGNEVDANAYVADGTLIGHYAIDEPFYDFSNMSSATLEEMCRYQKSFENWSDVPCFIRELNTLLYTERPTGGYQHVDAGWAQIADHHYDTEYNWDMERYFRDNLDKGRLAGLGLMYGFNLIDGGREVENCAKPKDPNHHNCAMSPAEIEALADALAAIGHDQGCGVNGWWISPVSGSPERNYFFRSDVQAALAYLYDRVGGLRPGSCGP